MSRRVLLLGLALLLALAGTTLVLTYVSSADSRAMAGQEPVAVLVVAKEVPAGTSGAQALEEELIAERELPQRAVPVGALSRIDVVSGLVAVSTLHPGEILLPQKFTSPVAAGTLPIPKGHMAVSVELTDPGRVAGFVRPGSEVAVFNTFEQAAGTATQQATRVLLPRVTVLAAGPVAVRAPGATKSGSEDAKEESEASADVPVTTSILTLSVDQSQAQKLVHATNTGELYFALLTPESASAPSVDATTTTTLFQ